MRVAVARAADVDVVVVVKEKLRCVNGNVFISFGTSIFLIFFLL